ncbi:MAG: hypothetical protein ABH879_09150 [archaeon]
MKLAYTILYILLSIPVLATLEDVLDRTDNQIVDAIRELEKTDPAAARRLFVDSFPGQDFDAVIKQIEPAVSHWYSSPWAWIPLLILAVAGLGALGFYGGRRNVRRANQIDAQVGAVIAAAFNALVRLQTRLLSINAQAIPPNTPIYQQMSQDFVRIRQLLAEARSFENRRWTRFLRPRFDEFRSVAGEIQALDLRNP